jgi:hypothetical protein
MQIFRLNPEILAGGKPFWRAVRSDGAGIPSKKQLPMKSSCCAGRTRKIVKL